MVRFLITLAAAAVAARGPHARGESALPLILRLQHEHDNLQPVHRQKYAPTKPWHRRLVEGESNTLTTKNTKPIRIQVNFDSLDKGKAPEYSACFKTGDWFRRGLPVEQTPPSEPTCIRGEGETLSQDGCWGVCEDYDVIKSADARKVEEVIQALMGEIKNLLAVPPTEGLRFTASKGMYERALESRGYTLEASCASDCTVLSGVAVDEDYCAESGGKADGFDVVLSVTKPPGIAGIAGTGSSCAADQAGRPLWAVVAWHTSIVGLSEMKTADLVEQYRSFVIHEVLHGLGFTNTMFNYARDSVGDRKDLITLKEVVDTDGATDEVWFFTKGRAYEMAQAYFECDSDSASSDRQWDGLPLMGLPEAGRGAHWETRVMRDDVMSYGMNSHVSSITLAAMEDLGFYLANYTAAGCMSWGRKQGCDYVRYRCGKQIHDQSAEYTPIDPGRSSCSGDPFWAMMPNAYVASKCERGNDPCATATLAGFESPITTDDGLGSKCDAQCEFGADVVRSDCQKKPSTDPEGASDDWEERMRDLYSSIDWQAWLVPLVWLTGIVLFTSVFRKCVCPSNDFSFTIAAYLDGVVILFSVALVVGASLMVVYFESLRAFVGYTTVICLFALGIVSLLFSIVMAAALRMKAVRTLRVGFGLMLVLVLVEIIFALLACYWVYSLGAITGDTLDSLFGTARSSIDDFLGDALRHPTSLAEGLVCKTYQTCCYSEKLSLMAVDGGGSDGVDEVGDVDMANQTSLALLANGTYSSPTATNHTPTCLVPAEHNGATTDLELAMHDPSAPNFCPYTSGAPAALLIAPPSGSCVILESLVSADDFTLEACQTNFCESGTNGYLDFVRLFVGVLQLYALPFSIVLAVLVIVQLVLACNLKTVANRTLELNKWRKNSVAYNAHPQYTAGV